MGSRDRPHREAKKKPKDKTGLPKVQPMTEPPMQVEIIRKPRKPKPVEDEEPEVKPTNEALERLALGGVTYEISGEVHTPPTFARGVDISKAAGETKGS